MWLTELLGVAEPLAHEIGYPDVNEDGARLLGDGFGQHGLAGPGRAVEEHPLLRAEELAVGEELGAAQGQDDELVERLLDLVEAADGLELDVDFVGVDDVARNHILQAIRRLGRACARGRTLDWTGLVGLEWVRGGDTS